MAVSMGIMRSLMFVPGHRERMIEKALSSSADVLLLDIEDGVPPAEKPLARARIAEAFDRIDARTDDADGTRRPARFVRINAIGHERMYDDLESVLRPGLDGLCLPKVETVDDILLADRIISEREADAGLAHGSVRFLVAIESAEGLLNAPAIGRASSRIVALMFGAEDFGNDLSLPTSRVGEASELLYARSALVVAAASARVGSVDGVWPDIRDPEGLRKDAVQARRLGFTGKSLIHPGQIDVINDVFRPDEGEVEYANRVVAAFEEAESRGDGAIALGGQLVDLPIVHRARRVLEMATLVGATPLDPR